MLLLLLAAPVGAAAWTLPAGEAYTKVWDQSLVGTRTTLEDGHIVELPGRYQDHALHVYGELGLGDRLTAVVSSAPVAWSSFEGERALYSGTSLIGLRQAITTGRTRVAVELRGGGTPGAPELAAGEIEGRSWTWRPALRGLRGEAELQVGRSFGGLWAVGTVGTAGFWGNELDPAVMANLQVGGHPTERLMLASTFSAWLPPGPIEVIEVSGRAKTRYVGLNIDLAYACTERLSLVGSLGGGIYVQSNAAAPNLGLGLSWKGPLWGDPP